MSGLSISGGDSVAVVQFVHGSIHVLSAKSRVDLIEKILAVAPPEICGGYADDAHIEFLRRVSLSAAEEYNKAREQQDRDRDAEANIDAYEDPTDGD